MSKLLRLLPVGLLLGLYAIFMIATNHRLTILDDESLIITTANLSTLQRMSLFLYGHGQHLHPPLSDILLHEWLRLTHHSYRWLRVPAIFMYIAGLLVTARCGELLGNRKTYWAVLLFGTLWPFGYFYARITGWYCVSFFFIASVTWCYFLILQNSSPRRWVCFTVCAILLIWSNYYGIAVLLLLLLNLLLFRRSFVRQHLAQLLISSAIVFLTFLPLLRDLSTGTQAADRFVVPLTAAIANIGYMLFAVFASVAVAPWYFAWSLPVFAAIAVLYVLLFTVPASRLFAFYFVLLILGLSAEHILDLKRLLFVTPWLILSVALCCSTASRNTARLASGALVVIFAIGWIAIATGRHRALSNFNEPWKNVVASTVAQTQTGDAIISDSGMYFFYLNYHLGLNSLTRTDTYLGPAAYGRLAVYQDALPPGLVPNSFAHIITVQGINTPPNMAAMNSTMEQVQRDCRLTKSEQLVPDPAAQYKLRFNPHENVVPFRIVIDHFDCSPGRS